MWRRLRLRHASESEIQPRPVIRGFSSGTQSTKGRCATKTQVFVHTQRFPLRCAQAPKVLWDSDVEKLGLTIGQVNYHLAEINGEAEDRGVTATYMKIISAGYGPQITKVIEAVGKIGG